MSMFQVRKRKRYGYYNTPKARVDYSAEMTEKSRRARAGWMRTAVQRAALGELKKIDTVLLNTNVSTTASITLINGCARGDDSDDRIGREIQMKSVQVRGDFYPNGTNAGDLVFWAVVYDRQTNAAAPVWTDVYTSDGIYPQLRNLDNRKRFKVLGSGYIQLPKAGAEYPYTPFEFYRKLNHPVEFNSENNGNVGDITTGSLFWFVRATTVAGDNDYTLQAYSRVRYSDV